jgi:uncharacterized protein YbjT (DUF2867 family)
VNVLVTGGTGALGRDLVPLLRNAGHHVRVLSRHPHRDPDAVVGDLVTGAGLQEAVTGREVIVHAASATTQLTKGQAIDVAGTRRLLTVARDAHVRHVVLVSIVGIENVSYPYYRVKLAAEAVVRENIVPWTIFRATQFHTLVEFFLGSFSRLPGLISVPFKWQFQPVDTKDVARKLVEVASREPAGRLGDFGGPEVRDFKSLARSWLAARKQKRRLVNLWLPFKGSRQVAAGGLLCPNHRDGSITFEQYLSARSSGS